VTSERPGIAGTSPTPRRVPGRRAARAGTSGDRWLLAWAIFTAILLLLPPALVPAFGSANESGLDKAGHVFLFLVLAALAVGPARARTRHPLLAATLGGLVFGAVLELLQGALGWRSAELADLMADGIGSALGVAAASLPWGRP
jgi:VanZ family protein